MSIYYAASSMAGAFTGLISFGVFRIDGPVHGWQYLFLIEGSLTVIVGLIALLVLPKSAATAYFLTEDEKKIAWLRIARDSSVEPDAKFDFRRAISVFKQDRLWPFYMMIGIGIGVPLYSVANWLPLIVARFGYSTVKTNLWTVAPNIVGSAFLVCVAFSSDFFKDRCLHLASCLTITCIGFIILAAVDITANIAVGYFACFLLCCGGFIASPLLSTWYTNKYVHSCR